MIPTSITIPGLGPVNSIQAKMLHPEDLQWLGVRFLDPTGRVFRYQEGFYRAVYPRSAEYVQSLFTSGLLDELYERNLTCRFTLRNDMMVKDYAFVVEQEASNFDSTPDKWNLLMLKDAALAYIDINRVLMKHNLALLDGHTSNMAQFGAATPKWFDLGSICPCRHPLTGLEEFTRNFLIPIVIAAKGKKLGGLARALTKNSVLGLYEVQELLNLNISFSGQREAILDGIYQTVQSLDFSKDQTMWSDYHITDDFDKDIDAQKSPRSFLIRHYIKEMNPQSVSDIGCNAGYFTMMAATQGAKVHAFDMDEPSNEKFYSYLKAVKKDYKITLGIGSAMTMNETDRNTTDLVLALALTHHLSLTQRFSFDSIAEYLSSYSGSALITEFMPHGLQGTNKPAPDELPKDYTLENMLYAFSRYFENVQTFPGYLPAEVSPRTLIVCTGRKQS